MAKFGMRNDYIIVSVYGPVNAFHANGQFGARVTGYAAKCTCILGDHYLAYDTQGAIVERTSDRGAVPDACIFLTSTAAAAIIDAWHIQQQRQHQHESEE